MLRCVKSGATRTQIMYRAYLSYTQLKEYLAMLQERDLVGYDSNTRLYRVTKKGIQFMNLYDKIHELVPNAEERNKI
jgi:predicted transcriptional regulator